MARRWDFMGYALLVLCFLVPVQTLIPVHTFRPVEGLILVATIYAGFSGEWRKVPLPLLLAFFFGIASVIVSTIFSDDRRLALDAGVLEVIVPFCVLYLFLAVDADERFMVRAAALFCGGVAVLSAAQIFALSPDFHKAALGVPLTGADFLAVKMDVDLMRRALTIGNSDNFASLWACALPLAVGMLYVQKPAWTAAIALIVIAYAGLLVYSRGAILSDIVALAAFWIGCRRLRPKLRPAILAVILIFIAINMDSTVYYAHGIEAFEHRATTAVTAATPKISPVPMMAKDKSGDDRMLALRRGWNISLANWPTGIGFGNYPIVEPHFTAPHSMLLLWFAEGGIFGLLSFLILAAYAPIRWLQIVIAGRGSLFALVCLTAVCAFMLKATIFGASFSVSSNIVWGFGIAMLLAGSIRAHET